VPREAPGKPLASISLDLDNLWSYLKIHGDAGWASFPSYLDPLADIVLDRLRAHDLKVTVFVVGQDAALPQNARALAAIAGAGHEIGNHSFSHEPWFHTYSYEKVQSEISEAETFIERATGQRPRGFRGPGFSLSADTLRVLADRDYLYDASTFPTFVGPVARAYYFFGSGDLSKEEREKRKQLFGSVRDGLRDIRPYLWNVSRGDGRPLLEIPVTTLPIARVPIHMSYIVYLALYSERLARAYLQAALALLRRAHLDLSFLLHPLDFLGTDRVKGLAFFPGMRATTDFKLRLFDQVAALIKSTFEPVTMGEHARVLLDRGHLVRASLR
jgi:peptidoglycan/xylan/chitin deacetylase (PgdA/CDA1 family)